MADLGNLTAARNDVNVVLCGEAGQGVQTVEHLLTRVFLGSGRHVFATKEYMSRIRGGSNSTWIRVSSQAVTAPRERIDILVLLSPGAGPHMARWIDDETLVIGDRVVVGGDTPPAGRFIDISFAAEAAKVGGALYGNVIAASLVACLLGVEPELLRAYLRTRFAGKPPDVLQKNLDAAERGCVLGGEVARQGKAFSLDQDPTLGNSVILSGTEAVALGALAGGCDFIAAYPMTPATGVLTFLAEQARPFGIVAEQAEDEIAAVNMALGAWYAGGRAMTSTSGGGFALMVEGLALAGMIESPLVVLLGMRPGPATGLPTRTEQGDLLFALHAGHGEFPRVVLAPGTLEQAFHLTAHAFDLADRFQVPVLILTDQFLMDTYHDLQPFDQTGVRPARHVVVPEDDYRRYRFTATGISPRAIPGTGPGLVVVDSDEHDEEGHLTEDLSLRVRMAEKRMAKCKFLEEEALPPTFMGAEGYTTLLVSWGSNFANVREAMSILGRSDVAFIHFSQVFPLHKDVLSHLAHARKVIVIENNAGSQFALLLRQRAGLGDYRAILKYDGLPFTVEELVARIAADVGGEG